jgi:hypothetical protein
MVTVTRGKTAAAKSAPVRRTAVAKKAAPAAVAKKAPVKSTPVRATRSAAVAEKKPVARASVAAVTAESVLEAYEHYLSQLAAYRSQNTGGTAPKASVQEEPEDAPPLTKLDRDEVMALKLPELRELAREYNLDEQVKKTVILEELEDKGLFRDEESDAEDDEDESEEDGDEEEEAEDDTVTKDVTREDLEPLTLRQLQKIAQDNEIGYKGLDKEQLLDALVGPAEDDEEEGGDEDENEPLVIDLEDLPTMGLEELQELAEKLELDVTDAVFASKLKLRKAIEAELSE